MVAEKKEVCSGDEAYIIKLRRELHMYPEVGFQLPGTAKIVKRELDDMGIPYTEQYGECSIVATINESCKGRTIGLRADMDALPVEEKTELEFRSRNPGAMHACGHDAHTAMLLGAARMLKRMEGMLECRVRLLFQPSEEGDVSGAGMMVEHGVMEDVDEIIALHVDNAIPSGKIGLCPGAFHAGCHPYTVTFHGKSSHATQPQRGHDALAMAVKAYYGIYIMKCRELSPFSQHILSISSLHGGTAHNIIAEDAKMLISLRFYDMELQERMDSRIKMICRHAAQELDGDVSFEDRISTYPVMNDEKIIDKLRGAACHILGEGQVADISMLMSSEDFAHFSRKKPGAIFHIGTGNKDKGCIQELHASDFLINEDAFMNGSRVMVQYVLECGEKAIELQ